MNSKQSGRRRFLKGSAALAGLAVGGIRSASAQALDSGTSGTGSQDPHVYGQRSRFETSARVGALGVYEPGPNGPTRRDLGFRTPLQDSIGIITPAPLHFILSHGFETVDVDPRQHRLLIHGLVDRPLMLTVEELKRLPSVSRIHFLECNANGDPARAVRRAPAATVQQTHGLTSCSIWTGVMLSVLLREAGVQKGASWLIAEGAEQDFHTKSIPLAKGMDDVLVAWGQNGEPLRPEQGYPIRLIVPGWEGINSVKFLRRIKLADQPTMGMREISKYSSLRLDGKGRWFQFEMGPKSVITRPSGGQRLPGRGFYEITGLAWSGGAAIRRVEVSTDDGLTWKDAQLDGPVHPKAHTRFGFPWTWNGEETVLLSRCTDERGEVQPTIAELATFWRVNVDYFRSVAMIVGHFNAIQPWKVIRDGSVENALYS